MRLVGTQVALRTAGPEDVPRLVAIANEPEVTVWWGTMQEEKIASEFVDTETAFAITYEDEVVGVIQYS